MNRPKGEGAIFRKAMLILLLSALTGCSTLNPPPLIVMPEAKATYLKVGQTVPLDGWLLSASALSKLLEKAESCEFMLE